ncbi:MAG TPA: alpha/beta family hydrolase [Gemmatimonadales bacterium]|nr:alpha/beta family hydrolase [Gemmatimonadales bacterium]
MSGRPLAIAVPELSLEVSGLLELPANPRSLYVLAHGAGAGMRHPFLEKISAALAALGVGTLRYQFPYMERGSGRTDSPDKCVATVNAAVARARTEAPGVALVAGGKSFGGRMTSTAQSRAPLTGVRGLVFLGFPLHAPGNPGITRAEHLDLVQIPMLFLQGTRDEFARGELLHQVVARLTPRATLHEIEGGDHSFKVPKKQSTEAAVLQDLATTIADWTERSAR